MTKIFYGNKEILEGQPTPFVGRQQLPIRYGGRWGQKTTITLVGQIVSCSHSGLIEARNSLIEAFNKDFKTLSIKEDSTVISSFDYVIVRDINFPNSGYSKILDYTITLDTYEQSLFLGVYGVLDPSDEWSFDESSDGIISVTHIISAKGFNTTSGDSNALDNAKDFVLSKRGPNSTLVPHFIQTPIGFSPCLRSVSEKIDRLNAIYSVTETYSSDKYSVDGVLRYTVDFDCGQDGVSKVTVSGNIEGCGMAADVTAIRSRYASINSFSLANEVYAANVGTGALNPNFISRSVSEDPYSRKLTFNVVYDNTPGGATFIDYSSNVEISENEITTVTVEGTIKGRGDLATRWTNVNSAFSSLNAFSYALQAYSEFGDPSFMLNNKEKSKTITYNKFQGEISFSYSWDNKKATWDGFSDVNYTLSFQPAIQKYFVIPLENDCLKQYYVANAGYASRGTFSFEGRGKIDCSKPTASLYSVVKGKAISAFTSSEAGNRQFLEVDEFSTGSSDINFKFEWSSESPPMTI